MKKRMIVEIEYPEGRDLCMDVSVDGSQAFHDCVRSEAIAGLSIMLMKALGACGVDHVNDDPYCEFLQMKLDVALSTEVIGYIEDEIPLYYDLNTSTWNSLDGKITKEMIIPD